MGRPRLVRAVFLSYLILSSLLATGRRQGEGVATARLCGGASTVHMTRTSDLQVGFVGCGTMSSAIVHGLCTLDAPPRSVVVSPRNAEKAAALSETYPSLVRVAASNQEVLDNSDTVFIGVLPKLAEAVIRDLRFEKRHTVVSLISTAPLDSLRQWLSPVPEASVVRAIPLPAVAKHMGTTLVTPRHDTIVTLFDALGTSV